MSKLDPSTMSDEEKLEYYRKAGIITTDDEDPADETPPSAPTAKAKVEDKADDEDENPVVPTEKKPDETPAADTPPNNENPNPPANPNENKDGADKSQHNNEFKPRPSKYIPLAQYQDEKKIHQQELATLQAKVDELSNATKKEVTPGTAEYETFITEYAEKYGMEVDDVKKFAAMVTPQQATLPPEVVAQLQTLQKVQTDLAIVEEEKHFNVEFEKADPLVQQYFPGLTAEQGKALRQSVFELSHTKEWHDKDLEYVLWKNKDDLLATLPTPEAPEKAPKGRVAESGRSGNHVHKVLAAADFKDGKTPFEELGNLDETDRNKIINDMDPQTYRKFVTFAGNFENGGGVKVNRGGKTVILK